MPQNSHSVSLWQVQIESKLDMLLSTGSYFQFEFSFSMVTKDLTETIVAPFQKHLITLEWPSQLILEQFHWLCSFVEIYWFSLFTKLRFNVLSKLYIFTVMLLVFRKINWNLSGIVFAVVDQI